MDNKECNFFFTPYGYSNDTYHRLISKVAELLDNGEFFSVNIKVEKLNDKDPYLQTR